MQLLLVVAAVLGLAQHHEDSGKLGVVHFANSCSPAVQADFSHGMSLLHSFEFGPAIDAFTAVHDKDAGCGIALWGVALAQWGNPFSTAARSARQLQSGQATAARAKTTGAKTDREREYIDAVGVLYNHADTLDQRARMAAYRDAMARVASTYPDDPEASTFYALSLAAAADPTDKSYADLLKAGAILERLWKTQPEHPGLAHYIIHSYDVPALAPKALAAARRYAAIAPDAPHALHMPSHTFTRLGYWQDSIATNILSAAAARKAGNVYEELHASDYEAYAYLQTAQDRAAKALVDALPAIERSAVGATGAAPPSAGSYASAAIPARYALERGAWAEAAKLPRPTGELAYTNAITSFARALGGARSGDLNTAKAAAAELQADIDRLKTEKEAYWTEQVSIQKLAADAWIALAEGRSDAALGLIREAADREDKTEKAAITPGPLAPAREQLGEMLLQLKRPADALVEFKKTMAKEPNRFRGIAGAIAAATQSGETAAARQYARQLLTICQRADSPGRPELRNARALAGGRRGR